MERSEEPMERLESNGGRASRVAWLEAGSVYARASAGTSSRGLTRWTTSRPRRGALETTRQPPTEEPRPLGFPPVRRDGADRTCERDSLSSPPVCVRPIPHPPGVDPVFTGRLRPPLAPGSSCARAATLSNPTPRRAVRDRGYYGRAHRFRRSRAVRRAQVTRR